MLQRQKFSSVFQLLLNTLGNYIAGNWNLKEGCIDCWRDILDFKTLLEVPHVILAVFIEKPTPFMVEFWDKLASLDYDKASIDLIIHSNVAFHQSQAKEFAAYWSGKSGVAGYHSVQLIAHEEGVKEVEARNRAFAKCAEVKCDYLFVVDSEIQLDNPHTLKLLIEQNR
jgi:procollagen-lysine,2-oxoglutarate 5-dioxygenase